MTRNQRIVIASKLLTVSPLAIHSGEPFDNKAEGRLFRNKDGLYPGCSDCDNLVVRDYANQPYLPGSSLKGVINHYLRRDASSEGVNNRILGHASDSVGGGSGGSVIFQDAFLTDPSRLSHFKSLDKLKQHCYAADSWRMKNDCLSILDRKNTSHLPWFDSSQNSYVEQMVAIDRRTGAADKHKLFNVEVLPAGLMFDVNFILEGQQDHLLQDTLQILKALAAFNLDPLYGPIQLGSNTNLGWGQVTCLFSETTVRTWLPESNEAKDSNSNEISDWLASESGTSTSVYLQKFVESPLLKEETAIQVDLQLNFQSMFCVRDPSGYSLKQAVENEAIVVGDAKKQSIPDATPRISEYEKKVKQNKDKKSDRQEVKAIPLLPASSFKGAVRSQLEKILKTIYPEVCAAPFGQWFELNDDSPKFVRHLLGAHSQSSGMWCSNFSGKELEPVTRREMVAIDRFTGGAADHAKFDVFGFEKCTLTGCLVVRIPSEEFENIGKPLIGWLALMLRDLLEGDISFGLGETKGFGRCTAKMLRIRSSRASEVLADDMPTGPNIWDNEKPLELDVLDRWNDLLNTCLEELRTPSAMGAGSK